MRKIVAEREHRIAENETRFRAANEDLLRRWHEMGVEPTEHTLFICECGDTNCTEIMRLTLDEYGAIRADSSTFVLVPGHDDTPTERTVTEHIVEKNERFAVVRKREAYRTVTERTDPRS